MILPIFLWLRRPLSWYTKFVCGRIIQMIKIPRSSSHRTFLVMLSRTVLMCIFNSVLTKIAFGFLHRGDCFWTRTDRTRTIELIELLPPNSDSRCSPRVDTMATFLRFVTSSTAKILVSTLRLRPVQNWWAEILHGPESESASRRKKCNEKCSSRRRLCCRRHQPGDHSDTIHSTFCVRRTRTFHTVI